MKQVNLVAALLLFSLSAFAQTVTPDPGPYAPMNQKYEYRWIKTSGGLWNLGKLIVQDSTDLRSITYVTTAPDNDSSKLVASTAWVKKNITASSGSGGIDSVRRRGVTDTIQEFYGGALGFRRLAFTAPLPENVVPYIGATQDVNLGEFGLQTGNVEFDNTPTSLPTSAGSMYYNDNDGTLDLILKGGNVTLQIGQETVLMVVNKTATSVNLLQANYQAVRVTGAQGQRVKVDLAQATTDTFSAETIGLVTETINNNQEGFITTSGLVRNINTTGSLQGETWADGDIIYLSPTTAGSLTKVKPVAPNHLVIIGYVIHSHITQGSIFVKVDNGYELDELHNVKITTPTNNQALIFNDTTDVWENKSLVTVSSYGKNATADSTILLLSNGTRYAAKDSVGGGGGGNIYTADGTLTGNRVLTANTYQLKFKGGLNTLAKQEESLTLETSATNKDLSLVFNNTDATNARKWEFTSVSDGTFSLYNRTNSIENINFNGTRTTLAGLLVGGANNYVLGIGAGYNALWLNIDNASKTANNVAVASNGNYSVFNAPTSDIYFTKGNATRGKVFSATGNWLIQTGGTETDVTSALLNVSSTTKGLLIPRMTLTQRNAIASPAAGLQVIVTGETGGEFLSFYNSSTAAWQRVVKLTSAGRLLLGTTTEGTNLLDVNGTARITGKLLTTSAEDDFGGASTFVRRNNAQLWFYTSGTAQGGIGAATGTNHRSLIMQGVFSGYSANAVYVGTSTSAGDYFQNTYMKIGSLPTNYVPTAVLELESTNRGFLPPRMTTTQKTAIASPAAGLQVYDTTLNQMSYYNGTTWVNF